MPPEDYSIEERVLFLRQHPELQYASQQHVEQEMMIDDARLSLELAERFMYWLGILLDPEAPTELKAVAAEMTYLHGFMDAKQGKDLPE